MKKLAACLALIASVIVCGKADAGNLTFKNNNLPYSVYLEALSESPELDPDTDYMRLGTIIINKSIVNFIKKNLVDKVLVFKSRYTMILYKNGHQIKQFYIALGKRPNGPKMFEGDKRTPEGTYILDYKKENSRFYKAFHISYPNSNDVKRARDYGREPGGMVMVHGEPYGVHKTEDGEQGVMPSNWTNGCIAMINSDIDVFMDLVDPGTIIEIKP